MKVNNNTNTTITPIAGESKPALNPVDKKIQQVSKGFFSSLASFFGKVVKALVVVATFPVSLPLMYLASKMKKAARTSLELKQETVVAPKEEIQKEPAAVIANPKEEIKDSPEDIFEAGRGIFEEARDTPEDIFEAGRGVFEETREPAATAHANRGSKSTMLKAGLAGLTGLGLAAAAVYYGKDIFTSAPLAPVKDIVSNSTAVGFPVQEFSDTGFCGLTRPPITALALPVETYFDKGVSMKAMIPSMTSALEWAIKNSNRTHA